MRQALLLLLLANTPAQAGWFGRSCSSGQCPQPQAWYTPRPLAAPPQLVVQPIPPAPPVSAPSVPASTPAPTEIKFKLY